MGYLKTHDHDGGENGHDFHDCAQCLCDSEEHDCALPHVNVDVNDHASDRGYGHDDHANEYEEGHLNLVLILSFYSKILPKIEG
jgi:hypothetical protein